MFKNRILARHYVFTFSELEQIPDFFHLIVGRPSTINRVDAEKVEEVAFLPPVEVLKRSSAEGIQLVPVQQVHSNRTIVLNRANRVRGAFERADGIVALEPGFGPVIRTADCVSVIAVISRLKAVGVFHAGWRGTCSRVVEKGVELLLQSTGAQPDEVVAGIGPAIRRCCYEVGAQVQAEFRAAGHNTDVLFNESHLDLVEANKAQMANQGVTRVLDSGFCTACHPEFFYSYRRDRTAGRMWTIGGFRAA